MSREITRSQSLVSRQDRHLRNGHQPLVVWFTGLSASGKTTIARQFEQELFHRGVQVYLLDGDNVRDGLNQNLGFSQADRAENVRRLGEVARLFMDAGLVTLVSAISPFQQDRQAVRQLFAAGAFFEVYVNCPVEECERRDPKGLYKKVRNGQIREFTGINHPYEEPNSPELVLPTDQLTIRQSLELLSNRILPAIFPQTDSSP